MQREELVLLVDSIRKSKCESQDIEVKSACGGNPARIYRTLSSFSNQDSGGIIVFGLDEADDFNVVGVQDAHSLQKQVNDQCKQMQPVCRPVFTIAEVDDKTVVSAEIPGLDISQRPCYYAGKGVAKGSYIRVGESDEPMTDYEIYSYDAYRKQAHDDTRIVNGANKKIFDEEKVEHFLVRAKKGRQNLAKLSDSEVLEMLGVIKDGIPTLMGIILFSKYPQASFPQFAITAVVIPGVEIGDLGAGGERFTDNRRIDGTLDEMYLETLSFLERNMKRKTIVGSDGLRSDTAEYPMIALREIILNALMHRDYSIHSEGKPVTVEIYSNRLEVSNPGGLYGRISVDELGVIKPDIRNKSLVNALEILAIAENRHSGIPAIRKAMLDYHLPPPVFMDRRGEFKVILYNSLDVGELSTEDMILAFCTIPRCRQSIAELIGQTPAYVSAKVIRPLVEEGKLAMTLPDKPKSKFQKYVACPKSYK